MPLPRNITKKSDKYHKTQRGATERAPKDSKVAVGPVVLGVLLFVVVGSALLQIIQNARSAYNLNAEE